MLFVAATAAKVGGVESWTDRAVERLPSLGFDPVVALVHGQQTHDAYAYREHHPDLPSIVVDGRGLGRDSRVRAVQRAIGRTKPAFVVPLGVYDAFLAAARLKQTDASAPRLVARTQSNFPEMMADLADLQPAVDVAICNGRMAKTLLTTRLGYDPARVRYVPNGCDAPTHSRPPRSPDAPLRLLFAGRLSPSDKRCGDLVPLVAALHRREVRFTLDVVGDGPARAELDAAFASDPVVTLHGRQPHAALYERFYPQADALLLLSESESFGIVLPEAMQNGVVPICSEYRGFFTERIVEPERTGLTFPVGDAERAAEQVARLQDDDDRESLAAAARKAAARYSWDRCLTDWAAALRHAETLTPQVDAVPEPAPLESGRLTRLGIGDAPQDRLRRLRRVLFGPAVPPGGEEWPFWSRRHGEARLDELRGAMQTIDASAVQETVAA